MFDWISPLFLSVPVFYVDLFNKVCALDSLVCSSFLAHHDSVTESPTKTKEMLWAEEFLFNIQQAERPLERYVEEFLSVVHLVSWSDATINVCFQMGLNDDKLFSLITPDDCRKPVAEFINLVLALCHSEFLVDVEDYHLPPICKHVAAPANHQPAFSMCRSNELAPSGPPSLTPVLHNSSLVLSPEPVVSSRTPAVPAASARTPAAPAASARTPAAPAASTPAAIAASTRTPPAVSTWTPAVVTACTQTPPAASPTRSWPIMMANVLDPPLMSVRAADIRVAAEFPESSQVSDASPESSQVAAVSSESSQVAAAFHESSQVAAASPESSQVTTAWV
ncbi:hypothetical protein M9458_001409 [Cirrhinus mrigala]|uniref:Retrotransposon gag domain-containing protein n=1 Tax=Cirrhinus mrigala TaxID=683832 RepID=A0ABD0RYI5_CIRMR